MAYMYMYGNSIKDPPTSITVLNCNFQAAVEGFLLEGEATRNTSAESLSRWSYTLRS